jgi:hypothetical protein
MKKKNFSILILFLFVFASLDVTAQSIEEEGDILQRLKAPDNYYANIRIELDPRIEENYYKHLLYNKKQAPIMGYRIRIFSGSGNDAYQKANETRARFLSRYEDIEAYISYVAPDYKVYVGDCRTRSEVLKLFEKIQKAFPYAFLVSQPINVNKEK